MHRLTRSRWLAVVSAMPFGLCAVTSGCGAAPDGASDEATQVVSNEVRGEENQGVQIVGDAVSPPSPAPANSDTVLRVHLPIDGSVMLNRGKLVSTTSIVGKQFTADLFGGGTILLRIDSAVRSDLSDEAHWDIDLKDTASELYWSQVPFDSTWLYGVSIVQGNTSVPFCRPYASPTPEFAGKTSRLAVPIDEYFTKSGQMQMSTGSFTFACLSGVAAKCYKWKYYPWSTAANARQRHWACTRAAKADYCGDGRTFTADGTGVDVYDGNIRIKDADTSFGLTFEDGWDTLGARCINHWRYTHLAPAGISCSLTTPFFDNKNDPIICNTLPEARSIYSPNPIYIGLNSHQVP